MPARWGFAFMVAFCHILLPGVGGVASGGRILPRRSATGDSGARPARACSPAPDCQANFALAPLRIRAAPGIKCSLSLRFDESCGLR